VVFGLGVASRRQAPPTLAAAQVVYAGTGTEEVAVLGALGVYRPDPGPTEAGVSRGGFFDLDMAGLEGQTRRRIVTDLDAWHWENLSLPAGVRFAPFRATVRTDRPITAVARFGPVGLEGKLASGPVAGLDDAVLVPPGGRNLAVRLGPDGVFRAGGQDALPEGHFMATAVLSDRQQRRQELYRQFTRPPTDGTLREGNVLLAWGDPLDLGFALGPKGRQAGDALLVVPLRLERPAPGVHVTIPGPLVTYQRVLTSNQGTALITPSMKSTVAADQRLRFQLPPEVLPFKVESARLVGKISALSRQVVVTGHTQGGPVELHGAESPLGPFQIDLDGERLPLVDQRGGLHVSVSVSDPVQGGERKQGEVRRPPGWTIEYIELEVTGRTLEDKELR
jgi:hypothetical protein